MPIHDWTRLTRAFFTIFRSTGDASVPHTGGLRSAPTGIRVSICVGGCAGVLAQCDDRARVFVTRVAHVLNS